MKKEITQIVLKKTITIESYWCKDDFETNEEWEEFLKDINPEELLIENFYGEDLGEYIADDNSKVEVTYIKK